MEAEEEEGVVAMYQASRDLVGPTLPPAGLHRAAIRGGAATADPSLLDTGIELLFQMSGLTGFLSLTEKGLCTQPCTLKPL